MCIRDSATTTTPSDAIVPTTDNNHHHGTAKALPAAPAAINPNKILVAADDDDNDDDTSNASSDSLHAFIDQARPAFLCPLSNRIMRDPVQTMVGSTYERKYIARYLKTHDEDPETGMLLFDKGLRDNRGVRDAIEEWKEELVMAQSCHSQQQTYIPRRRSFHSSSSTASSSNNNNFVAATMLTGMEVTAAAAAAASIDERDPYTNHLPQQHEMFHGSNPALEFTDDYTRSKDTHDTLKVICLGTSSTGSDMAFRNPKDAEGKLGVHRSTWNLQQNCSTTIAHDNHNHLGVHCNVFSFYGQNVHHATQKLFFSSGAIYVIVWDMGATNPSTYLSKNDNNSTTASNSSSRGSNEEQAKAALEHDICEKVQFWVEVIQQQEPGAVILPVASLDGSFGSISSETNNNPCQQQLDYDEAKRRCLFLKEYLTEMSLERSIDFDAFVRDNVIFGSDEDPVLIVGGSYGSGGGIEAVKSMVLQQSGDASLFPKLRQPLTPIHLKVQKIVNNLLCQGVRIANVSSICDELEDGLANIKDVRTALQWLSDGGEVMYYGEDAQEDTVLGGLVVLDPNWIVSALASIVRPDIHNVIKKMMTKSEEDDESPAANDNNQSYHGPVASQNDVRSVWRAMLASDSAMTAGVIAEHEQLLEFLQCLFTQSGVMVSLEDKSNSIFSGEESLSHSFAVDEEFNVDLSQPDSKLLFFPSLLRPGEHSKFLRIYHNSIFSKTMLAQSVQFHRFVSPVLLERICASILSQMYARVKSSSESSADAQSKEGTIYVKEVLCWRTLLCLKLGLYTRTSHGDVQPSFVDVFAHLVESTSDLCVGASLMGGTGGMKQSLIISAKGEGGNEGEVIWKGGYHFVTEAIQRVLNASRGVEFERHYFCPACLAKGNIRNTRFWNECVLQRALEEGEDVLICENGHNEKVQLLAGPSATKDGTEKLFPSAVAHDVHADVLMRGVVMVGLYDEKHKNDKVRKVGSGFVIDADRGLIVTAAHTLMKLWGMEDYGRDFDGIEGAKAVIGIIPEKKDTDEGYPPAVFRYFATIYNKDESLERGECHLDACVLQITSRFENDVDGNGDFCGDEISVSLTGKHLLMKEQGLQALNVTESSQLGEPIRILGFDQPDNTKVNRSFGISAGFVYKQFETQAVGGERYRYMPRKKTVLMCPTIGGHSGGPCVNQKGEVIGILSCADFTEKSRSYLVPTSEWIDLLPKNGASLTKQLGSKKQP